MAKILNREAMIKTAQVEIKALTVSGKQVTQALFKQIPGEHLIDRDTLQLRGVPWGRVNYHVDCNECSGDHMHIVWQLGDQLRRSVVEKRQGTLWARAYGENRDDWAYLALLTLAKTEEPRIGGEPLSLSSLDFTRPDYSDRRHRIEVGRISVNIENQLCGDLRDFWRGTVRLRYDPQVCDYPTRPFTPEEKEASWDLFSSGVVKRRSFSLDWVNWTHDEAVDRWLEMGRRAEAIARGYESLYQTLSQLDQLFIAV